MVELIVVLILVGVLGAIGASRFFNARSFSADAFAEQTRSMLRYAQKRAIANNTPVFVHISGATLSLCFSDSMPCAANQQVLAPSGTNSGRDTAACGTSWYCEPRPPGLTWSVSATAGTGASFYFDRLGSPLATVAGVAQPTAVQITISGDGESRTVSVAQETGHVF